MNVLNIAWKDLLLYVKDRSALLELFVLPVVFTFILVGLTSGFYNEDENADEAVPLAVANLDEGGAMAGRLLDALAENAGFRIDQIDPTESQMLLVEGDIPRLLTIPAGFTAALEAGERVTLDLRVSSDDIQENEAVRLAVEGVARSLSMQRQIVAGLEQVAGLAEADPESQAPFPAEQTIAQAESQFAPSAARPLVVVRQETPSSLTEGREDASFDSVQIGVPGVTVLFVFLTAQSTAQSIYQEKRTGSFRRLLSAPMSKATLLAGKMLPTLLISLVQVAVIFAARFIFPSSAWRLSVWRVALGPRPARPGRCPLLHRPRRPHRCPGPYPGTDWRHCCPYPLGRRPDRRLADAHLPLQPFPCQPQPPDPAWLGQHCLLLRACAWA